MKTILIADDHPIVVDGIKHLLLQTGDYDIVGVACSANECAQMLKTLHPDVLVLDECTSGLDDKSETDSADAERILEYIVRYANSDKKRIIIISTHQNIDGFKSKLADEFKFRNLQFAKEEEKNLVKEV